jgi:plastocyanin
MRTRIAVASAAAALVGGCGGGGATERPADAEARPASSPASVTVKTFSFAPDPLEIAAGQTVTWTNRDSAVHTVTSGTRKRPDGSFDERLAESSGTSTHKFEQPGTYRYFCSLHSGPGMTGAVVVR